MWHRGPSGVSSSICLIPSQGGCILPEVIKNELFEICKSGHFIFRFTVFTIKDSVFEAKRKSMLVEASVYVITNLLLCSPATIGRVSR